VSSWLCETHWVRDCVRLYLSERVLNSVPLTLWDSATHCNTHWVCDTLSSWLCETHWVRVSVRLCLSQRVLNSVPWLCECLWVRDTEFVTLWDVVSPVAGKGREAVSWRLRISPVSLLNSECLETEFWELTLLCLWETLWRDSLSVRLSWNCRSVLQKSPIKETIFSHSIGSWHYSVSDRLCGEIVSLWDSLEIVGLFCKRAL